MSNYRRAHWIERNGHSMEEVGHKFTHLNHFNWRNTNRIIDIKRKLYRLQ